MMPQSDVGGWDWIKEGQQKARAAGSALGERYWGNKGQGLLNTLATDPLGSAFDVASVASMTPESIVARAARLPARVALAVPRGAKAVITNDRLGTIANAVKDVPAAEKTTDIPGARGFNLPNLPDLASKARNASPKAQSLIDRALSEQAGVEKSVRDQAALNRAFGGAGSIGARQGQAAKAFKQGAGPVLKPQTSNRVVSGMRLGAERGGTEQHLEQGVAYGAHQKPVSIFDNPLIARNVDTALKDTISTDIMRKHLAREQVLTSDAERIKQPPSKQPIRHYGGAGLAAGVAWPATFMVAQGVGLPWPVAVAMATGTSALAGAGEMALRGRKYAGVAKELVSPSKDLLSRVVDLKALRKLHEQAVMTAAEIARQKQQGDEGRR